jgi:transcriptional regulator with XRE-family HTH domain
MSTLQLHHDYLIDEIRGEEMPSTSDAKQITVNGAGIKSGRKLLGFTQEALAAKTGLARETISRIEGKTGPISLKLLYQVMSLGIDLSKECFDFAPASFQAGQGIIKACPTCQTYKVDSLFSSNSSTDDGLAHSCKPCMNAFEKKYYEENKEAHIKLTANNKARYKERNRLFVEEYLEDKFCHACSHPLVLKKDGDHESVSQVIQQGNSIKRLEAAIENSRLVCPECENKEKPQKKGHGKNGRAKLYSFNGITDDLLGWARRCGVEAKLIWDRMDRGWTFEEAISKDPSKFGKGPKLYTYQGKTMTLQQWAEYLGMKINTLKKRIDVLGWSFEKAITTPLSKGGRKPKQQNKQDASPPAISVRAEDPLHVKSKRNRGNFHYSSTALAD